MKDKQYTIQGVKLTMGVMTLGQDKKLIKLLNGRKIDFEKMTGGVQNIINYLISEDLIETFLQVILKGDIEQVDMDEMSNPLLVEIVTDFFGLNGGWITKLVNSLTNFLKPIAQTTRS